MRDEADVRRWLAATAVRAGVRVVWHEPPRNGHGATTGHPDATLKWPDGDRVEVELKCWVRLKCGDFAAKLRREQVRYHYRANLEGARTVLVWGALGEPGIWALPGCRAPQEAVSRVSEDDCTRYLEHYCDSVFISDVKLNLIK